MIKLPFCSKIKVLSLCIGLTGVSAFGQSSVTSVPAGAVFYHFPTTSDTNIGLTLARPSAFEGRVASVDLANSTITFTTNPGWAANQFTSGEVHYLYIKSGAEEGMYLTVTGNTEDSVTVFVDVGDRIDRIVEGEYAAVVPYSTPRTFLEGSAYDGMRIVFCRDRTPIINPGYSGLIEYNNGEWYAEDGVTVMSDTPLYPGEGFVVRNVLSTFDHVAIGLVPMASARTVVRFNILSPTIKDQRVSFFVPVDFDISELTAKDGETLYAFNMTGSGYFKSPTFGPPPIYCYGNWYDLHTFNLLDGKHLMLAGRGFMYRDSMSMSFQGTTVVKQQPYLQ